MLTILPLHSEVQRIVNMIRIERVYHHNWVHSLYRTAACLQPLSMSAAMALGMEKEVCSAPRPNDVLISNEVKSEELPSSSGINCKTFHPEQDQAERRDGIISENNSTLRPWKIGLTFVLMLVFVCVVSTPWTILQQLVKCNFDRSKWLLIRELFDSQLFFLNLKLW